MTYLKKLANEINMLSCGEARDSSLIYLLEIESNDLITVLAPSRKPEFEFSALLSNMHFPVLFPLTVFCISFAAAADQKVIENHHGAFDNIRHA
jgi:hypothetical protein